MEKGRQHILNSAGAGDLALGALGLKTFTFTPRTLKLNWRALSGVNLEKVLPSPCLPPPAPAPWLLPSPPAPAPPYSPSSPRSVLALLLTQQTQQGRAGETIYRGGWEGGGATWRRG